MLPLRYTRSRQGILVPPQSLYDIYATDVAGRGELDFTFNYPATPITAGSPLVVTNNTELATALATPGKRIQVAAGSYNALALAQPDQDWEVDNGATFAGLSGNGFNRVRVTGGNVVTSAATNPHGFEDLILKNVNIEALSTEFGVGSSMFSRLAVIQCTIYNQRTGFYTPGDTANDAGVWGYDLLAAGNYVSGGMDPADPGNEPAFRIQAIIRSVQVDNRARCGFENGGGGVVDTKNTFRSHYGNQEFYGRRNMTEWGDGVLWGARANNDPVQANNRMGRHWWLDYDIFTERLSAYAFRGTGGGSIAADWLQPIVVDGNRGFTDVSANDNWIWQGQAGDSIGSNTTAAYQAPPALGSWLTANGIAPGADH